MIRRIALAAIVALVVAYAPQPVVAVPPEWALTDLGTLGGSNSYATAINKHDQVVGWSVTSTFRDHAFLWQGGVMTDLGTLGGSGSYARGINDRGQVVGMSWIDTGYSRAFLWQDGVMTDLGTLGGDRSSSWAYDAPGDVAPFGAGFVAVGKAYAAEAIWLAPPVELPAVAPEATTVVEGRWEAVAPMPQARAGQTAAVGSDGTVYFFGGLGMRGGELSTVVAYDPATNRWSSRRSLPAPLVTGSAAVLADDGRIYIFGEGTSRHPVYAYDPATDRWTTPSRHAAFGAAAGADGRIYATFGGVCVFDPATSRWDTCEAREVGYSRVLSDSDGQIYVISDRRIWSYDTVKQQATPLTLIPTVRSGHAAVVDLAGRIWVIGGRSTRQATLVEVYDPAAGSWTRGPDLPGPRVSAAAVVGRDGTIYVLGGDGGDGLRADVLSRLTNPLAR